MALLLALIGLLLEAQALRPLSPEEAFRLVQAYLGKGKWEEVYKFEYGLKPKEGWVVYEFQFPGSEVWLEAQSRRVVLYRPKKPPKHLGQAHIPLPQALALVRSRYGEPWKLELELEKGLLIWEAKGPFGEVWLEAGTGKEVLRR
ncbi:hypothetical protein [Thermus islandicus]|uniref:hypothetical protein n=1 Tax=Thermus islandicus TaxID=540988 RepID=UPI0003B67FBD|nr:hypothetical protein [Thermus islandicus]